MDWPMPISETEKELLWKRTEGDRKKFFPAGVRTMAAALSKAVQPVRDVIQHFTSTANLIEQAPKKINVNAIRKGYLDLYLGTLPKFAEQSYQKLKNATEKDDHLDDWWFEYTRRYVQYEIEDRIVGVGKTTENRIRTILSKAIDDGLSIDDVSDQLDELGLDEIISNRSSVIARTEIINASNKGSIMGARSTRLNLEKVWIRTYDSRTRDEHTIEETVPIDQPFIKTGEELDYPGDPSGSAWNIIQCRCSVAYQTK
jgi:hypothetical protein